ncbi:MAG: long-chain fatty acid--CoA ligase [Devosia sp.]|uniref:class I adenylate-forming enzyme family protein n=1 Tax=Devosia sp. TaxID=1871048 RepID=UPI001AD0168C|nr:fatty acid--CoA ligase family protein [Devosia sp.]MBN9316084.1 long-chain fatty acid--CoA ligase [Devosia sp.]
MRFLARLASHGRKPAVVTDAGELDYEALLGLVGARHDELAAAGIGPTSVVGLEIEDEVEHLVFSLALLAAGASHMTLATHDPVAVKQTLAARSGMTHHVAAGQVTARGGAGPAQPPLEGVVYLKTSGTTGDMNIVAFTETQIGEQSGRHPEYAGERLLRLASIEHNNSTRHRLYCAFMGGVNVFRPHGEFDVADFCRRHAVTCLDISRMHASDLANRGGIGRFEGVKLRTGGSAIPIDVRRAIEQRVTPLLFVRYASTESGAIAMAGPGEHDEDESVGRPLPGVELEVVDADNRPVPPGTTGRIRLRAAGMATGYLGGGEQSAARFRDGWFWPGDVGLLRSDGRLVVQGRQDDMMILNGLNIFPSEIERVLERHPAVSVAAALPLASTVHGQIPVAAVELRPGAQVTARELQDYARGQLALRAPRKVLVLDALPRNSQGKILRREIASAFQKALPRT